MSIRTELPPGCSSLRMEDGTRYKARKPGGFVNVSEGHADAINRLSGNGDAGLVTAKGATSWAPRRAGGARRAVPGPGVVTSARAAAAYGAGTAGIGASASVVIQP